MIERGITVSQLRRMLDELEARAPADRLDHVLLMKNDVANLVILDADTDGDGNITRADYVGYLDLREGTVSLLGQSRPTTGDMTPPHP